MLKDILVVDDEEDIRELVCDLLKEEGYTPHLACEASEALRIVDERMPSVVILDIWLQGSELDGLGILEVIKRKYPHMVVLMMSGHGTIDTAVNAMKMGAYDYLVKPFSEERLLTIVRHAFEVSVLQKENLELKEKMQVRHQLIGESQAIKQLQAAIKKVACASSRVMITGPQGSGKRLIAEMIHKASKRVQESFVILNPTGMSLQQFRAAMFGESSSGIHGAPREVGVLEKAHRGTLYIDEVADMSLEMQNLLLRFLQDGVVQDPVSKESKQLDVRVIVSTNRNIEQEISQGRFREELYYRLRVVPIECPALSDYRDDIPLLSRYFIEQFEMSSGLRKRNIREDAMAILQSYDWPGNVRQLKNVIEWLLIMSEGESHDEITTEMLPSEVVSSTTTINRPETNNDMMTMPLREARELFEKQYLSAQMHRFGGNISKTATFVGMERSALHRKLKSLIGNQSNPPQQDMAANED